MLSGFLKKLMFVKQFSIDKGRIELLGDHEIMLHASALLALQEIDRNELYGVAKKVGYEQIKGTVKHANVYREMKNVLLSEISSLAEKIGQGDEGTIKTLQEFFNVYGLGEMIIENIDNENKKAVIVIKHSTIAEEWVKKNGKSKEAVCSLTSGVIAGMFSYIFKKEVNSVEKECLAKGDDHCVFNVG